MYTMSRKIILSLALLVLCGNAHADLGVTDLQGFNGGAWRPGFRYIGGTSNSATNGGNVSLGTYAAIGGTEGDYAVVTCACSSASAVTDPFPASPPTGLTELTDQTNGGTTARQSTSLGLVTAANAGTTVTCTGGGGASEATVGTMLIFRGGDLGTQPDITTTTSSGNSTNPNPNDPINSTTHSMMIATCSSAVSDANPGTMSGWATSSEGLQSANANDTGTDQSIGTTWRLSGIALNPSWPIWSSWASGQWVCASVVLRQFD